MNVVVFGATGATGLLLCRQALAAGHTVRAVSRRDSPLPLGARGAFSQVRADAVSGVGVADAVADADAVLSTLGASYRRGEITVYSAGTRAIVAGLRASGRGRRLVVVSSGLTYPPPPMNWFADHLVFPFLRGVLGRSLYADMRRMEEYLHGCDDIDWTVMRPGRLFDRDGVSDYRLNRDAPTGGYTSRADLAAAMLAELGPEQHIHQAMSPTTTR
jgi:nucleoside-diphosphate-sugar epimerase